MDTARKYSNRWIDPDSSDDEIVEIDDIERRNQAACTVSYGTESVRKFYLYLCKAIQFRSRLFYFVNSSYLHGIRFLDGQYGMVDR